MNPQNELSSLTELIFTLHNRVTVWKTISASNTGLSPSQSNALEIIGHNYSLKMKELASQLGVSTGTLTATIDRLEKKKLVVRKNSEHDRRSIMLYLTENGRALFLDNYKKQLEFTRAMTTSLTAADKKALLSALDCIVGKLREMTP
ncbi:MAG: MarR family transcriptional regulator [Proteobacteria bacterium]|nr:MarR family transcriptional regulator [Pseudomonadota bacterium]MBU1737272.1 MarR family transcriptional regulator [Pseudomonadota bacterium]